MSMYDGKWADQELKKKAEGLVMRAALDRLIGESGLTVLNELNAYDSGFEAGVLAQKAGLGDTEPVYVPPTAG